MSQSLADKPLQQFLNELASAEPIPGGGSVAALGGALAASLLAMVCHLTIGKKGYEAVQDEIEGLLAQIEPFQSKFRELMQADIDAYSDVMNAYRLPKTSPEEQARRARTIQDALKRASDVPLRVAEECNALIELARPVAEKGNKNATSDAGVGSLIAEASLRGAALNVSINLASIKDQEFVAAHRDRIAELARRAAQANDEILQIVEGRM